MPSSRQRPPTGSFAARPSVPAGWTEHTPLEHSVCAISSSEQPPERRKPNANEGSDRCDLLKSSPPDPRSFLPGDSRSEKVGDSQSLHPKIRAHTHAPRPVRWRRNKEREVGGVTAMAGDTAEPASGQRKAACAQ